MAKKYVESAGIFKGNSSFFSTLYAKLSPKLTLEQLISYKKKLEDIFPDPAIRIQLPQDSSEQSLRIWKFSSDFLGIISTAGILLCLLGLLITMRNFWPTILVDAKNLLQFGLRTQELYLVLLFRGIFTAASAALLSSLLAPLVNNVLISHLLNSSSTAYVSFTFTPVVMTFAAMLLSLASSLSWAILLTGKNSFLKKCCYAVLTICLLWLCSRYLTRSWTLSFAVIMGSSLSFLFFPLLLWLTMWSMEKIMGKKYYLWRLIFASWREERSMYLTTVAGLGLVTLLSILLYFLAAGLNVQLSTDPKKPDLFLFNLQSTDKENLEKLVEKFSGRILDVSPMVRAKLLSINGVSLERMTHVRESEREADEERQLKNRSVSVTYRKELTAFEKISKGSSFENLRYIGVAPYPISLEHRYAKKLGVNVGDKLLFDIQGKIFPTYVANLRTVYWLSLRPNFFILFPSGVLEQMSASYLSVVKVQKEKIFLKELAQQMGHVSAVSLKAASKIVSEQISTLMYALSGLLVLFYLLAIYLWFSCLSDAFVSGLHQAKLLFYFGMRVNEIFLKFFLEYILLSAIIFLSAPVLTYILGYFISQQFFDGIMIWSWTTSYALSFSVTVPSLLCSLYFSWKVKTFISLH
jgi:putative ABC transport system permease protein